MVIGMPVPYKIQKERKQHMNSTRMSPSEYCQIWIPIIYGLHPDERGYRAKCIIELSSVTELATSTIEGWGSNLDMVAERTRPIVERTLAMQDALNKTNHLLQPFIQRMHQR